MRKGVTFPRALAACGGGHVHVPGVATVKFHGLRIKWVRRPYAGRSLCEILCARHYFDALRVRL